MKKKNTMMMEFLTGITFISSNIYDGYGKIG
jgi:hypothetical protein